MRNKIMFVLSIVTLTSCKSKVVEKNKPADQPASAFSPTEEESVFQSGKQAAIMKHRSSGIPDTVIDCANVFVHRQLSIIATSNEAW